MASPSNNPTPSLTSSDIDAWLLAAAERRAALQSKAASPWPSHYLQDVVTEMSALLQEAFEEVRVVSAQSREESQSIRARGHALCERSAHLLAESAAARERLEPLLPPPPEALHEAESRVLEMFREDCKQKPQ